MLSNIAGSCVSEFEDLYEENRADLSECSGNIRGGSYDTDELKPKQNNVVLIFDASGSMAGRSGAEVKIAAAKAAVGDFVSQLEGTDVQVGVVVYGHKGDNTPEQKVLSCQGVETLYRMGDARAETIEQTLNSFQPTGWTPIADALEQAYVMLAPYTGDEYNNSIVLISDGIETCDGDPAGMVRTMQDRGLDVTANVIGFAVDSDASKQLRSIAQISGGEYFAAASRADLDFALQKHTSYMSEFDYRMQRVSENLTDINTATSRHFNCVQDLEIERANMMLDIYADQKVEESCAEEVDDMYSAEYEKNKERIWNSFDALVEDFQIKSRQ